VKEVMMGRVLVMGEAEVAKRRCAVQAWRKIVGRRTDAIVRLEEVIVGKAKGVAPTTAVFRDMLEVDIAGTSEGKPKPN